MESVININNKIKIYVIIFIDLLILVKNIILEMNIYRKQFFLFIELLIFQETYLKYEYLNIKNIKIITIRLKYVKNVIMSMNLNFLQWHVTKIVKNVEIKSYLQNIKH